MVITDIFRFLTMKSTDAVRETPVLARCILYDYLFFQSANVRKNLLNERIDSFGSAVAFLACAY